MRRLTIAMMHKPGRDIHPEIFRQRIPDTAHSKGKLWDCARNAWLSGLGSDGHHMVIHDDIRPCAEFKCQVNRMISAMPEAVMCLWSSRSEVIIPPNGSFYGYSTFSWGGALLMPRAWIREFIEFCDKNIDPTWPCDDTRLTLWCCHTKRTIYVPVPNLVQHGELESTHQDRVCEFRSYTFEENPGVISWSPRVIEIPGDREAFITSRRMHYVNP